MIKVITYGTYDLLHFGHIRLLERAKALGDWLIVGVTADDFDKSRGKVNVEQSLIERIEAVKATGLADEIIVEEYEGQKIDDIKRLGIDIFTVGSDWVGKFDYLNEYCKVVYLERTEGVSSTELRAKGRTVKLGVMGNNNVAEKYMKECTFVNGAELFAVCTNNENLINLAKEKKVFVTDTYEEMLKKVDAVYIVSRAKRHYELIKKALECGKHVLCESPICMSKEQTAELFKLAKEKNLVLMDAIKTAYATAYYRLLLLIKSGAIGQVVSIDATCTSLKEFEVSGSAELSNRQNSISAWGPTAMLPVFQLLGTDYKSYTADSLFFDEQSDFDLFTKINFSYPNATATVKVGKGIKAEGELIVSGTKGYIYVPAPWWKTDYFEIRYENPNNNRRYFYQLDGEGIRQELVEFVKAVKSGEGHSNISQEISEKISEIVCDITDKKTNNVMTGGKAD